MIKFLKISWLLLVLRLHFFDVSKCWWHISGTIFIYLIFLCNTFNFFSYWIFWSIALFLIFKSCFLSDLIINCIWCLFLLIFKRLRIHNFNIFYWLNIFNFLLILDRHFDSIISPLSFCLFLNSIIFFRLFINYLRFCIFLIFIHDFFYKISAKNLYWINW